MNEQRGLTWSGKWRTVNPDHPDDVALCGAYVYRDSDPHYPDHLKRIKDGTKKSTGVCKSCARSAGVKTVTVELPKASWQKDATEDENGAQSWEYPDGEITVYDDGFFEWRAFGFNDSDGDRLRQAAAALLAAADASAVGCREVLNRKAQK